MKYLKKYENNFTYKFQVGDLIEQYGREDTAKFLDILLKGKEAKIIFCFEAYTSESVNEVIDVVRKIYYISTSHFTIIQLDDEGKERYVIYERTEIFCENPNIKEAQLFIDSKKFNL